MKTGQIIVCLAMFFLGALTGMYSHVFFTPATPVPSIPAQRSSQTNFAAEAHDIENGRQENPAADRKSVTSRQQPLTISLVDEVKQFRIWASRQEIANQQPELDRVLAHYERMLPDLWKFDTPEQYANMLKSGLPAAEEMLWATTQQATQIAKRLDEEVQQGRNDLADRYATLTAIRDYERHFNPDTQAIDRNAKLAQDSGHRGAASGIERLIISSGPVRARVFAPLRALQYGEPVDGFNVVALQVICSETVGNEKESLIKSSLSRSGFGLTDQQLQAVAGAIGILISDLRLMRREREGASC